jgi:hypothetical protein
LRRIRPGIEGTDARAEIIDYPQQYKNAWQGDVRKIAIGQQGQALLAHCIDERENDEYVDFIQGRVIAHHNDAADGSEAEPHAEAQSNWSCNGALHGRAVSPCCNPSRRAAGRSRWSPPRKCWDIVSALPEDFRFETFPLPCRTRELCLWWIAMTLCR